MARLLIVMVAVALTGAGCAAQAPGQAVPAPGESSTRPPVSPSRTGIAPPINSPELDLSSFESRVCDLLSPAQLATFAIRGSGEAEDSVVGPACDWNPPDTTAGARVDVAILSKTRNGWEGVYERRDKFAFFEEAGEINGYPAVHVEVASDGTEGTCATTVGASRDLVFQAGVFVNVRSSAEYKDACSVSDRVAGLVIDTLKGGR